MGRPRISYDRHGTPGVWADDMAGAYFGMGFLHGRHRSVQTLILSAAARGVLGATILPRPDLVGIDLLGHRLGIPEAGPRAAEQLTERGRELVDAYVAGTHAGLKERGKPASFRIIAAKLPWPDRASIISGTLLGSFLGLAQCQERMERAIVDALHAGADPTLLERMFAPHLHGWEPELLRKIAHPPHRQPIVGGLSAGGGSNAWAVDGTRTARGTPLLCGDPHLGINQLPSLFMEYRAWVGDNYWLGATIPGLPGIGVGRNRRVAWAGTFAVADNIDFTVEQVEAGLARRAGGPPHPIATREVEIARRFKRPLRVTFYETDRGVLECESGTTLASRWAGGERASEAIEAYMVAPSSSSVDELVRTMDGAHPFSLHFVFAERGGLSGDAGILKYRQGGRIPKRSNGWSGLYPARAEVADWDGFYEGAGLIRRDPDDGVLVSANEARQADDGTWLATLAQPFYRFERIRRQLTARSDHDIESMKALQLDLVSLQALRLKSTLVEYDPGGEIRGALGEWTGDYGVDSREAYFFEQVRNAAVDVLADDLGGPWLRGMFRESEIATWWANGLDRLLGEASTWTDRRRLRLRDALSRLRFAEARRWGDVRKMRMPHMVIGGLPLWMGFDRGPFELPGSAATPCQGNFAKVDGQEVVVGPAYRFITDLADDHAYSALPGGIDGSRFSDTYVHWLDEYWSGGYHRLEPPRDDELREDIPS